MNMHSRGFTIVEISITITIMGILMVLAIVNLNNTQVQARDNERRSDVEAIAIALETYYRVGDDSSTTLNRYPTTALVTSETTIRDHLRDVDIASFIAPNQDVPTDTFIAAANNNQTAAGVSPQPTVNQYVYQPIDSSGDLCTSGECRKFNLFYQSEEDGTVTKVTSRNQ